MNGANISTADISNKNNSKSNGSSPSRTPRLGRSLSHMSFASSANLNSTPSTAKMNQLSPDVQVLLKSKYKTALFLKKN